uniref:Uncharacterized protein n=1 Tax=Brassica oleracea TaxID=3712 RepID=A0A3P6G738_BRAOL|nr:unnamed protein product [Brassica oleracea]
MFLLKIRLEQSLRRVAKVKDQTGRTPCRAEFFIASRKKSDGTFVCEEAKSRADELTLLMSENLSVERSNITASLNDEYSKVFGPERSGRVRCLGRGPTPSKLLKMSNTPNLEASNSEVFEPKSQVSGLQSQVQNLAGMIQQLVGATTVQREKKREKERESSPELVAGATVCRDHVQLVTTIIRNQR